LILSNHHGFVTYNVCLSPGATGKVCCHVTEKPRVQVMETASCVKQGKAAYNTPNGGTPSRTLHMRKL
jgi:hypothetical protein